MIYIVIFIKFINFLPNLEELDASFNKIYKLDDIDPVKCRKVKQNIIFK